MTKYRYSIELTPDDYRHYKAVTASVGLRHCIVDASNCYNLVHVVVEATEAEAAILWAVCPDFDSLNFPRLCRILSTHGIIFEVRASQDGSEITVRCYCYGRYDDYDVIRWTPASGWVIIDAAGNTEDLTDKSLIHWLGY